MSKRVVAGAVGIGAVLGSVGRDLPTALVDLASRGGPARSCGVEAALDCAVANLPKVFGDAIVFGLVVIAVTGAFAVAGASCATFGLVRLRRIPTGDGQAASPTRPDPIGLGLLVVGAALVAPAIWLAVSFVVFMAG